MLANLISRPVQEIYDNQTTSSIRKRTEKLVCLIYIIHTKKIKGKANNILFANFLRNNSVWSKCMLITWTYIFAQNDSGVTISVIFSNRFSLILLRMPCMHIMYFDLSHLYILPLLPPKYGLIPPNFMSFF